jgi:hypothetical protein
MNAERKRKLFQLGLEFDAGYLLMSDEQINTICNGCGPIKETNGFIPQSFVGLDISEACNIHDYDYVTKDYGRADWDKRFLRNMNRIIDADKGVSKAVTTTRKAKALTYYTIVRLFGGSVFRLAKEYFKP